MTSAGHASVACLAGSRSTSNAPCRSASTTLAIGYTIDGMAWGTIELEPEVEKWLLEDLDDQQYGQALMHLDLLEEQGIALGMPYIRPLGGKLYELRFYCGGARQRISYWIAPGRRIVMLTVFHKTKNRETAEVARAKRAMSKCQEERHTAEEEQ